jgi:hypothetical protein
MGFSSSGGKVRKMGSAGKTKFSPSEKMFWAAFLWNYRTNLVILNGDRDAK